MARSVPEGRPNLRTRAAAADARTATERKVRVRDGQECDGPNVAVHAQGVASEIPRELDGGTPAGLTDGWRTPGRHGANRSADGAVGGGVFVPRRHEPSRGHGPAPIKATDGCRPVALCVRRFRENLARHGAGPGFECSMGCHLLRSPRALRFGRRLREQGLRRLDRSGCSRWPWSDGWERHGRSRRLGRNRAGRSRGRRGQRRLQRSGS
jgi:hypothetical protein